MKAKTNDKNDVGLAGENGKSVPKKVTGSVKMKKSEEDKAILAGENDMLMGLRLKLRPIKSTDMPPIPSKGPILCQKLIQPARIDPKIESKTQFLSPARRGIKGGTVSAMKEKFDGHSKSGKEGKKPEILRLKKPWLKHSTPAKSKLKSNGRSSAKKVVFDPLQSRIEDFFRVKGDQGGTLDDH